jgi:DNA polymerase/3'-5' exonuclease PolX
MNNKNIIKNLIILEEYYKKINDIWRSKSYKNAIFSIKNYQYEIIDIKQITGKNKLNGVGNNITNKIKEYLNTGKIKQVEEIKELVLMEIQKNKFEKIWGVGPAKATKLWNDGFRTINDLKKNPNVLNSQQKIGLKYYEDLLKSLPKNYIDIFQLCIRFVLNKEFGVGSYKLVVAGSYRRQAPTSGDVDVLITSTNFTLYNMVSVLQKWNIITDILSMRDEKFMGIVHCPNGQWFYFRMDIEFLPIEEFASGLLYFTGSKEFNVNMRKEAKKKGFKLSQHGLFRIDTGERILVYTEEEIFQVLNLEYVEPKKR